LKKVHYAHSGGYTELGGMKDFLSKINSGVLYERIFPAVSKPRKIKHRNSGVTGKSLFARLLEKLERKKLDGEQVSVLVVVDDTDCRLSDEVARERFLRSVREFERRATEIYSNLRIIFIWAEPEVEKWFCLDKGSCFRNKPCGDKDLHRKLSELLESFDYDYNPDRDSCTEKFSKKFATVLQECGVLYGYSKRNDGSLYLKKVNPSVIESEDKFAAKGIKELKNL